MSNQLRDIEEGLFFIVGTGRCGSTLLQTMLAAHSRICMPPETKFFQEWDPARFEGDPLPSDAAVDAHIARARRMWFWNDLELDEERLKRATLAGGRTARAMFLNTLEQWRDRLGKERVGEKTPGHHKRIERMLALFPSAKIMHIHRDPRDVVESIARLRWGGHSSVLRHARTWTKAMRQHLRWERALSKEQYRAVRFEELVREPEATLRSVCAFLGESFEPAMLRHHEQAHSSFNPREEAWKGSVKNPIDVGVIGKGAAALSPRQVRTIERVAGDVMVELGYPPLAGIRDRLSWRALDGVESLAWVARRMGRSACKRIGLPAPSQGVGPGRRQHRGASAAHNEREEAAAQCPT